MSKSAFIAALLIALALAFSPFAYSLAQSTGEGVGGVATPATTTTTTTTTTSPTIDASTTPASTVGTLKTEIKQANEDLSTGKSMSDKKGPEDIKRIWGKDCATSSELLVKYLSNCWSCFIFDKLFDAINELSYGIWEATKWDIFILFTVLLTIWIAYKLIGHIGSLTPQSPEEFWTKMGYTFLKAIFISVILTSTTIGGFIGYWIISPVVQFGAEFTSVVTKSYSAASTSFVDSDTGATSDKKLLELAGFGDDHPLLDDDGNRIESIPKFTRAEINTMIAELKEIDASLVNCDHMESMVVRAAMPSHEISYCLMQKIGVIDDKDKRDRKAYLENMLVLSSLGSNMESGEYFADCTKEIDERSALITKYATASGNKAATDGALTPRAKTSLMCMIESMNQEAGFGQAMGDAISCYGLSAAHWDLGFLGVYGLPDIPVIVMGGILWVACFLLLFVFFVKLIDACLRLGVLCSLMPILLIAWVFPSTVEFAKSAAKVLVHIIATFIVIGIAMALALLLLMQTFQVGQTAPLHEEAYDIRTLFYLNRIDIIHQQMSFGFTGFLAALACLMFALLIVKAVDKIAEQFSGVQFGFGTGVGDKVASTIARSATHLAKAGVNAGRTGAANAPAAMAKGGALKSAFKNFKANKSSGSGGGDGGDGAP